MEIDPAFPFLLVPLILFGAGGIYILAPLAGLVASSSFDGVLAARDTIDGTLTSRGLARSVQLVRLRVGDPP